MLRYFISYKSLIEYYKLEMDLDLFSPELVIIKKNKDGNYRVEPILYFNGYRRDLVSYADKITQNKKDVSLMVELTEEDAKKINFLYLKKFETMDDENKNHLKLLDDKEIKLISYNCYKNMSNKDIENGYLVLLEKSYRDKLSIRILSDEYSVDRKKLICSGIGSDIYFYTEDEEVLEKYVDEITVIKSCELDLYELTKQKVVVIDSISQDRVNDLNDSSLRALYELCNSSIPIYITEKDNFYNITFNKVDRCSKNGYMIVDFNIQNIMCDSLLLPLLKYINIYILENDSYEKINIEDYMKEKDILKYIKKPSKN